MLFESFSFDSAARSPSMDSVTTSSAQSQSPTLSSYSPTSPWPVPRYSISELTTDFRQQRLRHGSQIYSQPCETYANLDDDAGWTLEEQENADLPTVLDSRTTSARSYSPARRRLDRQAHSRLLCSAAHHKDIAALVMRMVRREDQCMVQPPTSVCYATPACEDDCDHSDMPVLSRASSSISVTRSKESRTQYDMHKTGACISKDARFRKERPRRQKSSDK